MNALIAIFPTQNEWYWSTVQGCQSIQAFVAEVVDIFGEGAVSVLTSDPRIAKASNAGGGEVQLSTDETDPLHGFNELEHVCILNFRALHAPKFIRKTLDDFSTHPESVIATVSPLKHHPCQSFGLSKLGEVGHVFPLDEHGDYVCLRDCIPEYGAPNSPGTYEDSPHGWQPVHPDNLSGDSHLQVTSTGKQQIMLRLASLPSDKNRQLIAASWPRSANGGATVWQNGDQCHLTHPACDKNTRLLISGYGSEFILKPTDNGFILPEGAANRPFLYTLLTDADCQESKAILPVQSADKLWWIDAGGRIFDGETNRPLTGRQQHLDLYTVDNGCLTGQVKQLRAIDSTSIRAIQVPSDESKIIDSALTFLYFCSKTNDDLLCNRVREKLVLDSSLSDAQPTEPLLFSPHTPEPADDRKLGNFTANHWYQSNHDTKDTRSRMEISRRAIERVAHRSGQQTHSIQLTKTTTTVITNEGQLRQGCMYNGKLACLNSTTGEIDIIDDQLSLNHTIKLPFETVVDMDDDDNNDLVITGWPYTVARLSAPDTPLFSEKQLSQLDDINGVTHVSRVAVSGSRIALSLRGSKRHVIYSLDNGKNWQKLATRGLGLCCDLAWCQESLFIPMDDPTLLCRFDIDKDRLVYGSATALSSNAASMETTANNVFIHSHVETLVFNHELDRLGKIDFTKVGIDATALMISSLTTFEEEEGKGLYLTSGLHNSVTKIYFQ